MKKLWLPIIAFLAMTFSSCLKDNCSNEQTFTRWTPIYMTEAQIRVTPQYEAARPMRSTGKIYFYKNYILINEPKQGVHILDNTNPAQPKNLGFISIVGNVDMAIKGDFLYVDNYLDLLTIDISTIAAPKLTCRAQNVFQNHFPRDAQRGILVDYSGEQITEKMDCTDPRVEEINNFGWARGIGGVVFTSQLNDSRSVGGFANGGSTASAPAGVGGSMARFTLVNNYLYTVDNWQLNIFNLDNLSCPSLSKNQSIGWNIETIYPVKDKLFFGSTAGMFIYDISNPIAPLHLSTFTHARACDPVVVENDIAYVTLRAGTRCEGTNNQMDVVDVKNLSSPKLIKTHLMRNPKGLSIWDNTLYLCDDGLKIYDVSDPNKVDSNLKAHIKGFDGFDAIVYGLNGKKYLMVIAVDGLYQFDVTSASQPKEISKVAVSK